MAAKSTNVLRIKNWRKLLHSACSHHQQHFSPWNDVIGHIRHLECVTSSRKFDSVNRCLFASFAAKFHPDPIWHDAATCYWPTCFWYRYFRQTISAKIMLSLSGINSLNRFVISRDKMLSHSPSLSVSLPVSVVALLLVLLTVPVAPRWKAITMLKLNLEWCSC